MKIFNGTKISILDIWQGSEYAFVPGTIIIRIRSENVLMKKDNEQSKYVWGKKGKTQHFALSF